MFAMDKGHWEIGPWLDEPDLHVWQDNTTGYTCVIARMPESGHLNGYVGIDYSHALYGYDGYAHNIETECHGGVTYARDHLYTLFTKDDNLFWIGFDCNHGFDYAPGDTYKCNDSYYCTFDYVKGECQKLAWNLMKGKYSVH